MTATTPPSLAPRPDPIDWVAQRAGAWLPQAGGGSVHSVFRRACNVALHSGELITLLGVELGDLPRGIRCAAPGICLTDLLHRGQSVTIRNGVLAVPAAGLRVDFAHAPTWHGDAIRIDMRSAITRRALGELRNTLCRRLPAGGFAPLLFGADAPRSPVDRGIAARLQQALPALGRGVRTRQARTATAAFAQLVGLGAGLTPSGDDFVVGWLAALHARARATPSISGLLHALVTPLEQLALRTNAISRQQLVDAAHGRFGERIVAVLEALAHGEGVPARAAAALDCGHSSGADTLCGLLFGLSSPTTRRRPRASPIAPIAPGVT